jgi:hypothetical protein
MRSDTVRQTITAVSFLVTLTVNIAANAVPIGGKMTNVISDQFHVFVIPAGYVFAIWGLIYTLLGGYTVWQGRKRNREDAVLRDLGWLPALTGVLNSVWIVLFQYELFALTVPVIVGLLVTLIAIHLRLWTHRDVLRGTRYWLVRAPWSVYLGWITVATIANIAQTGSALGFTGFGIDPPLIAAAVLLVGLAIAVTFVRRFGDAAYGWVIVWAYAGITVKEQATLVVAGTAGLGAVAVAVLVVLAMSEHRRGGSAGTAVGASTVA